MWLQFLFHCLSISLCHVLPSYSEGTWTKSLCCGRLHCGYNRRKSCRPLGGRGGPQRARAHNANIPSRVCDRSGVESMTLHDTGCTACPFYPCTAATRPNLVDTWSTVAFCGYDSSEYGPILPVRETKQNITINSKHFIHVFTYLLEYNLFKFQCGEWIHSVSSCDYDKGKVHPRTGHEGHGRHSYAHYSSRTTLWNYSFTKYACHNIENFLKEFVEIIDAAA